MYSEGENETKKRGRMIEGLPMPTYTPSEANTILRLPYEKQIYKLIRDGQIVATTDVNGRMRVPVFEVWRYARDKYLQGLEGDTES